MEGAWDPDTLAQQSVCLAEAGVSRRNYVHHTDTDKLAWGSKLTMFVFVHRSVASDRQDAEATKVSTDGRVKQSGARTP